MANRTGNEIVASWEDVWLIEGVRTPFADYNGALAANSPIDLGIKVAREVFKRASIAPDEVGMVVAGCMAQASFDAYFLPRHIGLYAGIPIQVPSYLVQRICGTGLEIMTQTADALALGRVEAGLVVGTESMSRNPIAAYTHRGGFRMGQVEFKDFLWEALFDPATGLSMGGTAENLARKYGINRNDVDVYAARSFERALRGQAEGFFTDELVSVTDERYELANYAARELKIDKKVRELNSDTHVRPSSVEALAKIRPAFGGVQTGGNSSGVVDGAGALIMASGAFAKRRGLRPLARVVASSVAGVPPEIMGIGPVPAIQALLAKTGLTLKQIDRFEINEAFAAQILACSRELGLDENKLNVNGGAIAIGHPLAATGVRLALTLSRELRRTGLRYGIASACIGGGQGIALLLENPDA
jgi:acetyl-CoA C-acetyltransferase